MVHHTIHSYMALAGETRQITINECDRCDLTDTIPKVNIVEPDGPENFVDVEEWKWTWGCRIEHQECQVDGDE